MEDTTMNVTQLDALKRFFHGLEEKACQDQSKTHCQLNSNQIYDKDEKNKKILRYMQKKCDDD